MQQEILSLTSLRFVAAIYVFIFHIQIHFGLPVSGLFKTFIEQGAVGMSLFFLLSGFVLTVSHTEQPFSKKEYAIRRVARLVPVYVLAGLVTLPWFSGGQPITLAQAGFILIASLLFLQAWFPAMFPYWNVGASWSLSVEAFFYALFPAIQRALQKVSVHVLLLVLAGAYFLTVLPALGTHLLPYHKAAFYVLPICRLPEFMTGVVLGTLYRRGFRLPHSMCVLVLSTVALVLGLGSFAPINYVNMNALVVPCFGAVILAAAELKPGRLRSLLEARWLVFSGRASYAFYLMQTVIVLTGITYQAEMKAMPLLNNPLVLFATLFVAIYALSAVVYLFVEEPARRAIITHFGGQPLGGAPRRARTKVV
jgi:peptidoglycan/LPS O-acetylase OafA/YrhL